MIEVLEQLPVRGAARHHADPARADRRVRPDHAVELADQPDRVQGGARARGRLHDGAEADRDRAAQRASCSPRSCTTAGVPAGVFNLVNGDGPTVGAGDRGAPRRRHGVVHRLDARGHRGGARGGADRSSASRRSSAASRRTSSSTTPTSPPAVGGGTMGCAMNSGQSCNAPTRMLVPRARHDEAVAIAKADRGVDHGRRSGRGDARGSGRS